MDRGVLKSVIADQRDLRWKTEYLEREVPENLLETGLVLVITGVRRCGKSTLLQQIRQSRKEQDYYLNFDDERLIPFRTTDFQVLQELFTELFGRQNTFYFDEIQNIDGWELFVRRLHDYGNQVILTGSNARMLSRELGTHLTGRYIAYELHTFSFKEFIAFEGGAIPAGKLYSSSTRADLSSWYTKYLLMGGFPKYIESGESLYLKSLFESILYRDIMVRNNLTNEREFLELTHYLATNISSLASYNSLAPIIGVSNATTVKNYLGFLTDSYLIFQVNKFDYSLKKQIQNPKKCYFIDLALTSQLSFRFSENRGQQLENLVYLELRRRGKEVFYHRNVVECDFIIRDADSISTAIQVSVSLEDPGTRERELKGLTGAMDQYGLKQGLIITEHEEQEIELSGKLIQVLPAWQWLLA